MGHQPFTRRTRLTARICDVCHRDRKISDHWWHENIQRNAGLFICRWCKTTASPKYVASRPKDFGRNPGACKPETIVKAAASRRGKFGENANAWKGGKRSLNNQVKAAVYKRYGWQTRIYERDGWKCVECHSTKQLDAHHTVPFSALLKAIIQPPNLVGDELTNWLADHPTLVNAEGITLCRPCHRAVHKNWGSHYPESK